MMAGIAMIVVGMTSEYYDRDRMLFFGGMFGAFASLSSVCNRLGFVAVVLLHDRAMFFLRFKAVLRSRNCSFSTPAPAINYNLKLFNKSTVPTIKVPVRVHI